MNFDFLVPVMYFTGDNFTAIIMKEEFATNGVNVAFIFYLN